MFTDVVGSTASAQANEAEALKLRDEQAGLVRPLFAAHHGREIKSMGDGFLSEFDSALHAVQCAIDIQQHLHERNSQTGVTPIQLRIGIHLGDVEQRETDIFGDAVNIASRVEPLAPPGGICISGEVFSQVRNKIPNRLEKLPPTALKGLQAPVDIYRIALPWVTPDSPASAGGPTGIAILPFANISPDPKDEYFADGLTEELITVLSQIRELRVIARSSVTPYKSTSKGVAQIGAELGVSSILEGSVRKAGSQLRITAQLIDVASQGHVWANSYNRELTDVFAVQVELAQQVADALRVELRPSERTQIEARPMVKPDSYLAYLKGLTLMRIATVTSLQAAKAQFELAVSLDDRNASAHAALSTAEWEVGLWYTDSSQRDWVEKARRSAARAIELDPNLAEAHAALAEVLWDDSDLSATERELKRAISLSPSFSRAHLYYANFLEELGRTEEALVELSLAEGADPFWAHPLTQHAQLLLWLGRFDEALVKIGRLKELNPPPPEGDLQELLAEYYLAQGDLEQALRELRLGEEQLELPQSKILFRAYYLALSGEKEQAKELLRSDPKLSDYGQCAHLMAEIYAEMGELDECFRLMNKALDRKNLPIFPYRLDPRLRNVREDPRFDRILKTVHLA